MCRAVEDHETGTNSRDAVEKLGLIAGCMRDSVISGASDAESRDDGASERTGAFVL